MADTTQNAKVKPEGAALILALDRQQSIQNPKAIVCPKDKNHGRLFVLKNAMLGCTLCGHIQPAELDLEQLEEPRDLSRGLDGGGPGVLMHSLRGRR